MIRKHKVHKSHITLGFDPHGGKHDLIWKRLELHLSDFESKEDDSRPDHDGENTQED